MQGVLRSPPAVLRAPDAAVPTVPLSPVVPLALAALLSPASSLTLLSPVASRVPLSLQTLPGPYPLPKPQTHSHMEPGSIPSIPVSVLPWDPGLWEQRGRQILGVSVSDRGLGESRSLSRASPLCEQQQLLLAAHPYPFLHAQRGQDPASTNGGNTQWRWTPQSPPIAGAGAGQGGRSTSTPRGFPRCCCPSSPSLALPCCS